MRSVVPPAWTFSGPVALLLLISIGCGRAPPPAPVGAAVDANLAPAPTAGAAGIAWLGRRVAMDPANPAHVRMSWPGVGFGVRFTGSALTASMQSDARQYAGAYLDGFFDVVVDGGAPTTFSLPSQALSTVPLASGLGPGEHEVWVTKRTEASLGATELFSLTVAGGALLAPPALPTRRIEVVGASIETGYGVGGTEGVDCAAFSPAQQDQSQAWPQLLANLLGAQLMNTSYSGKGMSSNIDISLDPVNTMPVVARLAEATDFTHPWDPSAYVPDVVAIAMGSNDWEGLGAGSFDANRLIDAYVDFVVERHAEAPEATYYVTLSPQIYAQERADLQAALGAVVSALNARGLSRVHYLAFPEYDGSLKGCDGHPPPALHASMAQQVASQVRGDVGW